MISDKVLFKDRKSHIVNEIYGQELQNLQQTAEQKEKLQDQKRNL